MMSPQGGVRGLLPALSLIELDEGTSDEYEGSVASQDDNNINSRDGGSPTSGSNTTSPKGAVDKDGVRVRGLSGHGTGAGNPSKQKREPPEQQEILHVHAASRMAPAGSGIPMWMRKQKSKAAEMDRRRPEAVQAVRLASAESKLAAVERALEDAVWLAARQRPYLLFEFVLPNGVLGGVDARAALRPFVRASEDKIVRRSRRQRREQRLKAAAR